MSSPARDDTYRSVRPRVPVRPTLGRVRPPNAPGTPVSAVIDLPSVSWFTNGRTALAHAARLSSIRSGDAVLVPSYHCESMIEPFAWLGAELVPYRIRDDLSIDLADIEGLCRPGIRAILVPQYFGHLRSLESVSRMATDQRWIVIEDCAHAFFNVGAAPMMGVHSDYVIASLPKFFPVLDGGVLASRRHDISTIKAHRVGLRDELRGVVDMIDYAAEYGRRSWAAGALNTAISLAKRWRNGRANPETRGKLPASRHGGVEFEPEHLDLSACAVSRAWPYRVRRNRHASARRSNWTALHEGLGDVRGIRFPIVALGAGDVPYVFAMEVENGEAVYPELKRLGVPAYRWETCHPGTGESRCGNTDRFHSDLIQLPCHQSLTPGELAWIIATVAGAVQALA